jgi:hypothetical protein
LTCSERLHKDDTVIGISGESMLSPLQFLIEVVEEDADDSESNRPIVTQKLTTTGLLAGPPPDRPAEPPVHHHTGTKILPKKPLTAGWADM